MCPEMVRVEDIAHPKPDAGSFVPKGLIEPDIHFVLRLRLVKSIEPGAETKGAEVRGKAFLEVCGNYPGKRVCRRWL